MKMMMMILRQLSHVIDNFDSCNSVHCRDIAQVPSVPTPPLVMSLLDNGDTDRGTDCGYIEDHNYLAHWFSMG